MVNASFSQVNTILAAPCQIHDSLLIMSYIENVRAIIGWFMLSIYEEIALDLENAFFRELGVENVVNLTETMSKPIFKMITVEYYDIISGIVN